MMIEAIRNRRSVRTFDGRKIDESLMKQLQEYALQIENPWSIRTELVFLDAKENGLSSPVLSGEPMYITVKALKCQHMEEACGYAFEKLMLKAVEMGLGTVWIGGTMKRELFEAASRKSDEERMPCITPIGYPAKMSFKERMMRKGVGADTRKKNDELFFENGFVTPLKISEMMLHDAFEAVRLAPSAVNKQPWRIVYKDGLYHFYEKKAKGYVSDEVCDMQKIDIGIAICHFDLSVSEYGRKTELIIEDPGIACPEDIEYIASLRIIE